MKTDRYDVDLSGDLVDTMTDRNKIDVMLLRFKWFMFGFFTCLIISGIMAGAARW